MHILILLFTFLLPWQPAQAGTYLQSQENTYADGQPLPNPPYNPNTNEPPSEAVGYARSTPDGKVLEWLTLRPNVMAMFNEIAYTTRPPAYGTLTMDFYVKINRVNGAQVWPNAGNGNEGFDKAAEFVGPNYRWTANFGIRAQGGPAGTWNIFVTNPSPGHFNPQCEVYDSYWQNVNGYGRGLREANACQPNMGNAYFPMLYDTWYRVRFTVDFASTNTGAVRILINDTKVLEYLNIKTCNAPCTHDRIQLWGTYNQPDYNGPAHSRYVRNLRVYDVAADPAPAPAPAPAPSPAQEPSPVPFPGSAIIEVPAPAEPTVLDRLMDLEEWKAAVCEVARSMGGSTTFPAKFWKSCQ